MKIKPKNVTVRAGFPYVIAGAEFQAQKPIPHSMPRRWKLTRVVFDPNNFSKKPRVITIERTEIEILKAAYDRDLEKAQIARHPKMRHERDWSRR
jgi:hypothetical protein